MGDVVSLKFPRLLFEEEVAELLGVSVDTVRRERKRGRLGFIKIGGRIRYAEDQVLAYLENQREDPCAKKGLARSADTGSASDPMADQRHGTEPGSMPRLDRRVAFLSAQAILSKPSSRSPNGC